MNLCMLSHPRTSSNRCQPSFRPIQGLHLFHPQLSSFHIARLRLETIIGLVTSSKNAPSSIALVTRSFLFLVVRPGVSVIAPSSGTLCS